MNTMRIPASKEEFLYLIGESREELVEMGFREWGTLNNIIRKEIGHFPDPSLPKEPYSDEDDKTIMLIPHSWYDFIPEGYALVDIFGGPLEFCHGKTSDDHRGGMLAYGVLRPANEMKQP